MRSPVTAMVTQFQSLSEVEQKVFLDLVDPQPEPEPKRTRNKRAEPLSSERRQSLHKRGLPQTLAPEDSEIKCGICGNVKDHPDHDKTYLQSHDFEGPKPARAGRKSKPKSEAPPSGQSSETGTDAAGVAASAASAGD